MRIAKLTDNSYSMLSLDSILESNTAAAVTETLLLTKELQVTDSRTLLQLAFRVILNAKAHEVEPSTSCVGGADGLFNPTHFNNGSSGCCEHLHETVLRTLLLASDNDIQGRQWKLQMREIDN